jgi:hypothetical protein
VKFWNYFWSTSFILTGLSFVLITLVVTVRGTRELLVMLGNLRDGDVSSGDSKVQGISGGDRPSRHSK